MSPLVTLDDVEVRRGGRRTLGPMSLTLEPGQRWVVLGPNGSGKTTLLGLLGLWLHPSSGLLHFDGAALGSFDVRSARRRVGLTGSSMAARLRSGLRAIDVVLTARRGALEPWWDDYDEADRSAARARLDQVGLAERGDQPFGTLSAGEAQRVLLARALVGEPDLLLADEPCASLDLAGRESVVAALGSLAASADRPTIVLVTHHLEEIPGGFDRALILRDGRPVAAGDIDEVLTDETIRAAFDVAARVERADGRFSARL